MRTIGSLFALAALTPLLACKNPPRSSAGLADRFCQLDRNRDGRLTAMVFVNGMIRSSYVDSADGKTPVETVSIKELIPHVDATYRTVATRAGRMVEGFSMGGGGAAKWGFKYLELFGAISIIDGALHKAGDSGAGRLAESFQTIYGGNREYSEASNPWNLAEKNAHAESHNTAWIYKGTLKEKP